MLRKLILLLFVSALALLGACSDDSGGIIAEDTSAPDTTGDDTGTTPDVTPDALEDLAGPDAMPDSTNPTDTTDPTDTTTTDVMGDTTTADTTDTTDTTTSAGANGVACTDPADCDSGFCYDNNGSTVCSECAITADCGLLRTCRFDTQGGFAICEGTGALGDACTDTNQCVPGSFCNGGACSECGGDSDCGAGGACVADANAGYAMCSGGLGDACAADTECGLGFCYDQNGDNACSECSAPADCGLQRDCNWSNQDGYAVCVGTGQLGAACTDSNQCEAGSFCNSGVCSECGGDTDCTNGGLCIDDTGNSGYYLCAGGLGDACTVDTECNSGFCFDQNGNGVCSDCKVAGDCGLQQDCAYRGGAAGYAVCLGTGPLGAACNTDAECEPALTCNSGSCSQCASDADCTNGSCVDDTAVGAWVCKADLGENCNSDAACQSGLCYPRQGPDVCSACVDNADCAAGTCDYNWGDPYARCIGAANLGDTCNAGSDCASGFCSGSVCSECEAAVDCGTGGACTDDIAGVGYYVCEAGYGEVCNSAADCASGFCYDTGFGFSFCSECGGDADCTGTLVCDFAIGDAYAQCVGSTPSGGTCAANSDCASGACSNGTCVGALGDECTASADCGSGFCFNATLTEICSQCETTADCGGNGFCAYRPGRGFAACN